MEVRYTPPALRRLADIVTALREVNPFAVERLGRSIARAFRRISTFPRSGPMVPEYPDLPIRQFFVAPYRFFYFIDEPAQTVWIVAVWHGRQLPAAPELPAK